MSLYKVRYYFYNVDVDECAFNSTKQLPFPKSSLQSSNILQYFVYMLRFRLMYNIMRHYFYNVDVDECGDDTDGCSQTCTNTEGSFTCGCTDGYVLNVDGTTCDGMHIVVT